MHKDEPQVSVPILRERIHYSFVWDKIGGLNGFEDVNLLDLEND